MESGPGRYSRRNRLTSSFLHVHSSFRHFHVQWDGVEDVFLAVIDGIFTFLNHHIILKLKLIKLTCSVILLFLDILMCWGHRERLRTRFLAGGHAPMPEYEILELLLFNAIPRIDVKPLAKRLLSAFGDLNGVIAASEHRILKIEGATPKVYLQLCIAEASAQRMG